MNTTGKPELKNQLRITGLIFYSLFSGVIIFFIIVMIIFQSTDNPENGEIDKIFVFIIPVFGLTAMFFARFLYNRMILKFNYSSNIIQKIANYRTAKIVSWAMIESACFLALIATMLTSNYLYTVVFLFLAGYFILLRPSKESLIRDMRLNAEESDLILKS